MPSINETLKKIIKELIWQARSLVSHKNLPCNFIIVGAQKAGTTSLYDYITLHPDVVPSYKKEIHYFSKHYNKSDRWYKAHFKKGRVNQITGEASPYYMFHPLAAARIKKFNPDIKIIVLLRNPAERAYSHYKHQVRAGTENLSFTDAINAESQRLSGQQEYIISLGKNSVNYQHYSYKKRGEYLEQIQRLEQTFPKKNILTMTSDDFFSDPLSCVHRVWDFFGLDSHTPKQTLEVKNSGNYKVALEDGAALEALQEYYKPFNESLFDHLQKDLGWNTEGWNRDSK